MSSPRRHTVRGKLAVPAFPEYTFPLVACLLMMFGATAASRATPLLVVATFFEMSSGRRLVGLGIYVGGVYPGGVPSPFRAARQVAWPIHAAALGEHGPCCGMRGSVAATCTTRKRRPTCGLTCNCVLLRPALKVLGQSGNPAAIVAVALIVLYLLWAELTRGLAYCTKREHLPSVAGIALLALIGILRAVDLLAKWR
eukprot:scaffold318_cov396-Prasinococcus_capsulatus_cf.AAC.14